MHRFEGNRGLAAFLGFCGVALLALVILFIVLAASQLATFTLLLFSAVCAIFGLASVAATGLLFLHTGRDAGASFVVDDEGITRRAWGRTTALAWRDLSRLEEFNGTSARSDGKAFAPRLCVLYGDRGQRVAVPFQFMGDDGPRLRGRLETHVSRLRGDDLRDLARYGAAAQPGQRVGFIVLTLMAPLFLLGGLAALDSGGDAARPRSWTYFGALCIAASPLLMLLGVELISRKLEVMSNGLAVRSVFSRRDIPFDQMESITIKVDDVEAPATEYAIMRSNAGGKIKFDSSMPGYRAVLELVRSRASVKCHGAGGVEDDGL